MCRENATYVFLEAGRAKGPAAFLLIVKILRYFRPGRRESTIGWTESYRFRLLKNKAKRLDHFCKKVLTWMENAIYCYHQKQFGF